MVSQDVGEKKSFQLGLAIMSVLGSAALSFESETITAFKRVKDLVMLMEMSV